MKNMTSMTAAYVGRKALTFVYFLLIARFTDVETTGRYYLLVSFSAVMTLLIDFGLANTLIREASRNPKELGRYLNTLLGLKFLFSLIAALSAWVLLNALDFAAITKHLVAMIVVMMIFESFSDTYYACLRVHHRMQYEAKALVWGQALTLAFGGLSLWFYPSIYFLVGALIVNQAFQFFYSSSLCLKKLDLKPRVALDLKIAGPFLKIAGPLLVTALLGQILAADTFILKFLTTDKIVGLFGVSSTFLGTLHFIPTAMAVVLFPALSTFHVTSRDRLRRAFTASWNALFSFALPLAVIFYLLPSELIGLIFGKEFEPAAPTLRALSLGMVPFFLTQPTGRLLEACNRQIANTILMGATVILNVALTLFLIPRLGAVGIAWAYVASFSFLLVVQSYFMLILVGDGFGACLKNALQSLFAAGLMVLAIQACRDQAPFPIPALIGSVVYGLSLVLARGMTWKGFNPDRAYGTWVLRVKQIFEYENR